jgi:hypothetical protein
MSSTASEYDVITTLSADRRYSSRSRIGFVKAASGCLKIPQEEPAKNLLRGSAPRPKPTVL